MTDHVELREPLTGDVKIVDRRTGRIVATRCAELAAGFDKEVVLRLAGEKRLVVRQELYRAVHSLEAQARTANPRGKRQRALTQRAALLRAVADQLA